MVTNARRDLTDSLGPEFDGINLDARNTTAGVIRIEASSLGNPHHIRFQNAEFIGTPNSSDS